MKRKMVILALTTVVVAVGAVAAYLFTIGPLGKPALASVNGEQISVARFQAELGKIDPASRELVREDPGKLLDFMIDRTLLLQQAKKEGGEPPQGGSAPPPAAGEDPERATIMAYLGKKMAALPPVAPEDVDRVYETHKDQRGGRKKEEALPLIRQMLEQQRQGEAVEKLITDLRKNAAIEINRKNLQALTVVAAGGGIPAGADSRKFLIDDKPVAASALQGKPVPVEILYMNHGPLLSTIRGIKELCSGYEKAVTVTWYDFESPEGEKFKVQRGIKQHIPLVVWIAGKSTSEINGKEIQFAGFPTGSGPPSFRGNWTMDDLRAALDRATGKK
jgi:hypothetical protein